jgi:hypothetical protein
MGGSPDGSGANQQAEIAAEKGRTARRNAGRATRRTAQQQDQAGERVAPLLIRGAELNRPASARDLQDLRIDRPKCDERTQGHEEAAALAAGAGVHAQHDQERAGKHDGSDHEQDDQQDPLEGSRITAGYDHHGPLHHDAAKRMMYARKMSRRRPSFML